MHTQDRNHIRKWNEGVLLVIALVFGVRWLLDPSGPFEPAVSFCFLLLAAIDFYHRTQMPHEAANSTDKVMHSTATRQASTPPSVASNFGEKTPQPKFAYNSASAFFAARFAAAFPGLRGTQWFEREQAGDRLLILLAMPLEFKASGGGTTTPIWWFRDGNLQIAEFTRIEQKTVLMDGKELRLGKIAAVHASDYKRLFVYVECEPMSTCGIYEWSNERIDEFKNEFGYVWEEYGLFRGSHCVSRAEYDDGAARIMGKIVQMGREVELRVRYLSPYNFLIAPHDSPINSNDFDEELERVLNGMLHGTATLAHLSESIARLPSNRNYL
jgi:hypothetical protein